ncbi:hypothetical protein BJ912DRAFT_1103365 [Pholiota molesta]|nr:hypothetical protein BJ912DRAFT_1103365 [Pholiota molesta]
MPKSRHGSAALALLQDAEGASNLEAEAKHLMLSVGASENRHIWLKCKVRIPAGRNLLCSHPSLLPIIYRRPTGYNCQSKGERNGQTSLSPYFQRYPATITSRKSTIHLLLKRRLWIRIALRPLQATAVAAPSPAFQIFLRRLLMPAYVIVLGRSGKMFSPYEIAFDEPPMGPPNFNTCAFVMGRCRRRPPTAATQPQEYSSNVGRSVNLQPPAGEADKKTEVSVAKEGPPQVKRADTVTEAGSSFRACGLKHRSTGAEPPHLKLDMDMNFDRSVYWTNLVSVDFDIELNASTTNEWKFGASENFAKGYEENFAILPPSEEPLAGDCPNLRRMNMTLEMAMMTPTPEVSDFPKADFLQHPGLNWGPNEEDLLTRMTDLSV